MAATYPKSRATNVIVFGTPINKEAKVVGATMFPGLLVTEGAAGITKLAVGVGETWQGAIVIPDYALGQGFSGVYATDAGTENVSPVGASQGYAVVDLKGEQHGWLAIGITVAVDALLYSAAAGEITNAAVGEPIGRALEAVTGGAAALPVRFRRET